MAAANRRVATYSVYKIENYVGEKMEQEKLFGHSKIIGRMKKTVTIVEIEN